MKKLFCGIGIGILIILIIFYAPKKSTNISVQEIVNHQQKTFINNLSSTVMVNGASGVVIYKTDTEMYVLTARHVLFKTDIVFVKDPKDTKDYTFIVDLIHNGKKEKLFYKKIIVPNEENHIKFYYRSQQGYEIDTIDIQGFPVYLNKERDLAVLKVNFINEDIQPVIGGNEPTYNNKLYKIACPMEMSPVATDGILGGFTEYGDETKGIFTGGTIFGNSGGGIFNSKHECVGVVMAVYKKGEIISHLGIFTLITKKELDNIIQEAIMNIGTLDMKEVP